MPKLSKNTLLLTDDAPISLPINLRNSEKYAIQLVYGTGSGPSEAKLQASLNYDSDTGEGDWTDIEGSDQTLDNAGGVHMWNVSNAIYPWVQVIVDGDSADVSVYFAEDPQPRRG